MGCDIHGWVEVRPYEWDNKYWNAMVDVDHLNRNYVMFDRLFGVRGPHDNVTPLAPNRGTPDSGPHDEFDDWRKINLEYWKADGHSYSWIGLEEINAFQESLLAPYPGYEENSFAKWRMLFNIMNELGKVYGMDNVRLVVWFDN